MRGHQANNQGEQANGWAGGETPASGCRPARSLADLEHEIKALQKKLRVAIEAKKTFLAARELAVQAAFDDGHLNIDKLAERFDAPRQTIYNILWRSGRSIIQSRFLRSQERAGGPRTTPASPRDPGSPTPRSPGSRGTLPPPKKDHHDGEKAEGARA